MDFTNDFFIQAQGCIERVFRAKRERIHELHGKAKAEFKPDHTVVTELDKQLEQELKEALTKFDQKIGFEGEEFGVEGSRDTYWLIDPIDGTESFVRGMPYVRNVATLVDKNEAVFTVIYRPLSDEVFVAGKGEGSYRNGQQIRISDRPLDRAWIEFNQSYETSAVDALCSALRPKIGGFVIMREFVHVAQGQSDGLLMYESGAGPWDFAPRALIIEEAGGRVANIGSDKFDFRKDNILATNPVIFDELMETVSEAVAKNNTYG